MQRSVEDRAIAALSIFEFEKLVEQALQAYPLDEVLAQSPLAQTSPVLALVIADEQAIPPRAKARALRIVLHWGIELLAPESPDIPRESILPEDNPRWVDEQWRTYLLLRYRFIEPIKTHIGANRSPGRSRNLMTKLGLTDTIAYKLAYRRALRALALSLRDELHNSEHEKELGQRAVETYFQEMKLTVRAEKILNFLCAYRTPVSLTFLAEQAKLEQFPSFSAELRELINAGYAYYRQNGAYVGIPALLQTYLHARQHSERLRNRHKRAIAYYRNEGDLIETIWHTLHSGLQHEAVQLIVDNNARLLTITPQLTEFCRLVGQFDLKQLTPIERFELQQWLGAAKYRMDDFSGAVRMMKQALKNTVAPEKKSEVILWLALLYRTVDMKKAEQLLNEALELLPAEHPQRLYVLLHFTTIRLEQSSTTGVKEILDQLLVKADSQKDDFLAYIHVNYADYYRHQREYSQSREHILIAIRLWERFGDRYQLANTYSQLAMIYRQLEEYELAHEALKTATKIWESEDFKKGIIQTLQIKAMIALKQNDYQSAQALLEKSIDLAVEIEIPFSEMNGHRLLARLYLEQRNSDAACYHFLCAYCIAHNINSPQDMASCASLQKAYPALQRIVLEPEPAKAEWIILDATRNKGWISRRHLVEILFKSPSTTNRLLGNLCSRNLLQKRGDSHNTSYSLFCAPGDIVLTELLLRSGMTELTSEKALLLAKSGNPVTSGALSEFADVSVSTALRTLQHLAARNLLIRKGSGRGVCYTLAYKQP